MNQLRVYQAEHGRTDEEMAIDLSALTGRKIGAGGYRLHSNKAKPPKAWAEALGLPAHEDSPSPEEAWYEPETTALGDEPAERETSATPKAPPGARVAGRPSAVGDFSLAKKRLVEAYSAIGAGASMITKNNGYSAVADTYAPDLADAWIAAARADDNVAKIVRFMESGGPVGELVVCHVLLVLGWVYVSGRGPNLDAIYGDKFHAHRVNATAQRLIDEAAAQTNGATHEGAQGTVGHAQV